MAATWPDSLRGKRPRHTLSYNTTPRPLAEPVVAELVDTYRAGASVKQLAEQFGIHRETAGKHLQAHGIDTREPKLSPTEIQVAADLYRDGWSLARLGKRFSVDDMTVRARLLEVGVVMRPRKGGKQKNERVKA